MAIGTFFACGYFGNRLEKNLEKVGGFVLFLEQNRVADPMYLSLSVCFPQARAEMHRKRGLNHVPPVPESTEWLNAMLAVVWPLIDPALFTSVVDMVEDVMQASLPKFVEAIRISDLGLGTNPLRIVAIRGLPDQQTDKDYPKEEWIYKASPKDSHMATDDGSLSANKQPKKVRTGVH
jgi:Ca2+-dependent lipid-binding protein